MKIGIVLVTSVLTLALVGCKVAPAPTSAARSGNANVVQMPDAGSTSVYKIVDMDNRNVCYVSDGYKSGGISCLPLIENRQSNE